MPHPILLQNQLKYIFDSKNQCIYFTVSRNASTLFLNILGRNPSTLKIVDVDFILNYLNLYPKTPIYTPFRDPLVRFKSGLNVFLYNNFYFILFLI